MLHLCDSISTSLSRRQRQELCGNFVWCDKNILKIVDIVIEKDPECSALREEIRRFLLPISVVQYNKAFVGVRTTFLLVLKQIV